MTGAAASQGDRPTTVATLDAFDRLMTRVNGWLADTVSEAFGIRANVLVDRLSQKIAEIGHGPFAVSAVSSPDRTGLFRLDTGVVRSNEVRIQIANGKISVPWKAGIRRLLEFGLYWSRGMVSVLRALASSSEGSSALLIIDLPSDALDADDDARFVDYCRGGSIGPLRNAARIIRGSDPLPELLRSSGLSMTTKWRLLRDHTRLLPEVLIGVLRTPTLLLICRELAYSRIAATLDKERRIDGIMLTCSSWWYQPVWMRNLHASRIHMLWYSQNPQVVRYRSETIATAGPMFRWMHVGTHWVWTRAFADYILTHSPPGADCRIVPPIVWYLPDNSAKPTDLVKIVVFDVPAVSDDVILRHGGETTNFYSMSNLAAFIRDILSVAGEFERRTNKRAVVHLKMKRGLQPHYAPEYFRFISDLAADGKLVLETAKQNPFSLIGSAHLVIAFPFTSPAYVAEYVGVPAIYYDPTNTIHRDDFADTPTVRFVGGRDALLSACEGLVSF